MEREVTPIGHCVGATLLVAVKDGGVFRPMIITSILTCGGRVSTRFRGQGLPIRNTCHISFCLAKFWNALGVCGFP